MVKASWRAGCFKGCAASDAVTFASAEDELMWTKTSSAAFSQRYDIAIL
jgi:hypothetical protein